MLNCMCKIMFMFNYVVKHFADICNFELGLCWSVWGKKSSNCNSWKVVFFNHAEAFWIGSRIYLDLTAAVEN